MYIAYNLNTKKVVGQPSENPFAEISNTLAIAKCDNIPQNYDYLLVDNIREETRVIKEAQTIEEKGRNEYGEEITIVKEIPAETETYYTCDLIAKFYEFTAEQIEKQRQSKYHALTEKYVRLKYSQSKMEAIINNYLDSENEDDLNEFAEMQKYRKECKARAKAEVYGVEK